MGRILNWGWRSGNHHRPSTLAAHSPDHAGGAATKDHRPTRPCLRVLRTRPALALLPLVLILSCGNGDGGSIKVPDELQACSGHGKYAPADNMQSLCVCDPGYHELMMGLAYEDQTPLLATSLCVKDQPSRVVGLAHPSGQAMEPAQATTLAQAGIRLSVADLPASLDGLSDWSQAHAAETGQAGGGTTADGTTAESAGLTIIGRIRLDDWNLTVQSAHDAVDKAMKGARLDYVVVHDAAVFQASYDQLGGCSDWQCFNGIFAQRRDGICHALSRVRLHCPWCQVGLAISQGADEHLTQLRFDLQQLGQTGECPYDFVMVDFDDVDPYIGMDPEKAWSPILKTMADDFSHWYLANVTGYGASAFDLATPDEIASRVARTAVLFRAAGFGSVVLPNLPGSVDTDAAVAVDASGKGTRVLDALSTYETQVGNAVLMLSDDGGYWGVQPDPPKVDQVLQVGLDLVKMETLTLDPKSPWTLFDAFGEELAVLRYGAPMAEQLAPAEGHFSPFYVEGSLYSTYPDAAALGLGPLFQNAWLADSSGIIPTGELAMNVDEDPELEWWGELGYYDPIGDGLFRRVGGSGLTGMTFYDIDHDGDLDMLFHGQQGEGGHWFDTMFNEDGWFVQQQAYKNGLTEATLAQLDLVLDQWVAQDFTGDGEPDLAGFDAVTSEVVILETTAEPGVFTEHRYSCPVSEPVPWWRAEDVDEDGQLDLAVVAPPPDGLNVRLDVVSRFLLRRGDGFVEVPAPCYQVLLSNAQTGVDPEVGPGFLCAVSTSPFEGLALYKWDGDALVQVWQDTQLPGWDKGENGVVVPYRAQDGAKSKLVFSSQYAIRVATVTETGLEFEKDMATNGQAVSGYFASGPDKQTFLRAGVGFQAAVSTPAEAASLAPMPLDWEAACPDGPGSRQLLDFDGDGKLDAVCLVNTSWEQKEHNEVGDPFAAWIEVTADLTLVSDIVVGGKAVVKKLSEGLFLRYSNFVCAVDKAEPHSPPWQQRFALGRFDSKPGMDAFTYSPVQHALLDMQPVAYLVSGQGGPALEIPAQDYLKVAIMTQSDCGASYMMSADLDEDGLDDVLLWDGLAGEVHFLCTDKGGGLDKHILHRQVGIPSARITGGADYNGDGHFDLLAVQKQEVVVLLGNGQCNLAGKKDWAWSTDIWYHNATVCDDLTQDGQTECFFECEWSGVDAHDETYCGAVMPKNGGVVPDELRIPFPAGYPGDTAHVTWGDFDGDGAQEIILGAGLEANGAYRWEADGFHFLGSHTPSPVRSLGDVDGDGADDALGAGWTLLRGRKATP